MRSLAKAKIIQKGVMSVSQLHMFFSINSTLLDHVPFALAYSLTLFAFLRIFNLVAPLVMLLIVISN